MRCSTEEGLIGDRFGRGNHLAILVISDLDLVVLPHKFEELQRGGEKFINEKGIKVDSQMRHAPPGIRRVAYFVFVSVHDMTVLLGRFNR